MIHNAIHSRIPAQEYFALDAVSVSRLKELRRSPQHYRYALTHPRVTEPLVLGTACHVAVLEPERYERYFAVWRNRTDSGAMSPRRGKVWDEFAEAHASQTVITGDQDELAHAVALSVRTDPVAMPYLASGEPEVVMTWSMGDRACKGRVDWITSIDGEPVLVGLKSARDCRPFIFGYAAAKLGYALQWAWYFNGYSIIKNGERPKMVEIVVESAPPHSVVVYRIPDDILLQGEENYRELLRLLAKCEASGEWPGPASEEQVLTLPSWYYPTDDDISDMGLVA